MHKVTPREIIREVSNVQTVVLPDGWFSCLDNNKSVFVSLYEWMLESNLIPLDDKHNLHGRTYVGDKLFKKFYSEEKKRLKGKLKIKGDDLDNAVTWSDANSGPKTEIGGCQISGGSILVIPESSRQALRDFSVAISRKKREATIAKIKDNAAGATFYGWLISQIDRPDRVGDVARDAAADKGFPLECNQYEEMKFYLGSLGASSAAMESLKEGWLEYLQKYPERIQQYAWCYECGRRVDVEEALLAWSSESRELFVVDDACLSSFEQYDQISSRPLSGVTHVELEELVEKDEVCELDAESLIETLKLWGVIPIVLEGCVYFIRSEKTHSIKIGFTASQVEKRLSSLQTAHPHKLQLLATVPGPIAYEGALHKRFARHRLEGEWFEPHPDLLAFISTIQ